MHDDEVKLNCFTRVFTSNLLNKSHTKMYPFYIWIYPSVTVFIHSCNKKKKSRKSLITKQKKEANERRKKLAFKKVNL